MPAQKEPVPSNPPARDPGQGHWRPCYLLRTLGKFLPAWNVTQGGICMCGILGGSQLFQRTWCTSECECVRCGICAPYGMSPIYTHLWHPSVSQEQQCVKQDKCGPFQGARQQRQAPTSRVATAQKPMGSDSVYRVFCSTRDFAEKLFEGGGTTTSTTRWAWNLRTPKRGGSARQARKNTISNLMKLGL